MIPAAYLEHPSKPRPNSETRGGTLQSKSCVTENVHPRTDSFWGRWTKSTFTYGNRCTFRTFELHSLFGQPVSWRPPTAGDPKQTIPNHTNIQTACTCTRLRLHHGIFEFGSGPNAQSLGEREERELFIRNNVHEVVCPVTAALHGPMWAGLTLKETEVPGPRYHG